MRKSRLAIVDPSGNGRVDPLVFERIKLASKRVWAELEELQSYKRRRGLCTAGLFCMNKATSEAKRYGVKYACAQHEAAIKTGVKLSKQHNYHTVYAELRKKELEAEREERRVQADKEKAREKLKGRSAA